MNSDAFVILGAAGEDGAGGGAVDGEGRVEPFLGLGRDGVEVGVEEEEGVGARPGWTNSRVWVLRPRLWAWALRKETAEV